MSGLIIGAVVLAAGQSKRMGSPKMILPWGRSTVIRNVVSTLIEAEIQEIFVVTGGSQESVEKALQGTSVRFIFNPDYQNDELLLSLQTGLAVIPDNVKAILVVLGDQPQIREKIVREICSDYMKGEYTLIIPSYRMKRGHPWLIDRKYWNELLAMGKGQTMRDFLKIHAAEIHYTLVEDPSILQDLDTPEDYRQRSPG